MPTCLANAAAKPVKPCPNQSANARPGSQSINEVFGQLWRFVWLIYSILNSRTAEPLGPSHFLFVNCRTIGRLWLTNWLACYTATEFCFVVVSLFSLFCRHCCGRFHCFALFWISNLFAPLICKVRGQCNILGGKKYWVIYCYKNPHCVFNWKQSTFGQSSRTFKCQKYLVNCGSYWEEQVLDVLYWFLVIKITRIFTGCSQIPSKISFKPN